MKLESARDLKQQLLHDLIAPFTADIRSITSIGARAVVGSATVRRVGGDRTIFGIGAKPTDALSQVQRSIALGVAPYGRGYRLAIRLQRPALRASPLVAHLRKQAKGEADIRIVGRIDKRAAPWYQRNTRPLQIDASIGHVKVTAGTIGASTFREAEEVGLERRRCGVGRRRQDDQAQSEPTP